MKTLKSKKSIEKSLKKIKPKSLREKKIRLRLPHGRGRRIATKLKIYIWEGFFKFSNEQKKLITNTINELIKKIHMRLESVEIHIHPDYVDWDRPRGTFVRSHQGHPFLWHIYLSWELDNRQFVKTLQHEYVHGILSYLSVGIITASDKKARKIMGGHVLYRRYHIEEDLVNCTVKGMR